MLRKRLICFDPTVNLCSDCDKYRPRNYFSESGFGSSNRYKRFLIIKLGLFINGHKDENYFRRNILIFFRLQLMANKRKMEQKWGRGVGNWHMEQII